MSASTKCEVEMLYNLTLSKSEAEWLKAILQNPLCDNESLEDSANRHCLWYVLDSAGVASR